MNVGIVLCIDWCITNHKGRIGKLLNAKPVAFFGVISYSVYLWQQIFLNRYSTSIFTQFPVNILLALTAALLSYYVVERPSLGFRRHLELGKPGRQRKTISKPATAISASVILEPVAPENQTS